MISTPAVIYLNFTSLIKLYIVLNILKNNDVYLHINYVGTIMKRLEGTMAPSNLTYFILLYYFTQFVVF